MKSIRLERDCTSLATTRLLFDYFCKNKKEKEKREKRKEKRERDSTTPKKFTSHEFDKEECA